MSMDGWKDSDSGGVEVKERTRASTEAIFARTESSMCMERTLLRLVRRT